MKKLKWSTSIHEYAQPHKRARKQKIKSALPLRPAGRDVKDNGHGWLVGKEGSLAGLLRWVSQSNLREVTVGTQIRPDHLLSVGPLAWQLTSRNAPEGLRTQST